MGEATPFILLDDARDADAGFGEPAPALLYENPRAVFTAHRGGEVAETLSKANAALAEQGGSLAGYIAYEAGLALEPRLAALTAERSGANGPLIWLGLFDEPQHIPAKNVAGWLATRSHTEGEGEASIGPLDPQLSPGGYVEAFETLQEAIRAGDIYQANLTYPLAGSYRGDPMALYAQLRSAARAGYGGIVFDGGHWLLSFSPELFFALENTPEGHLAKVKPMKGTRPRGSDEASDLALAEDLTTSVKDKAENLMIVDLMRNDLSRVAEAGTVRVDKPFAVESYPTVHQMVSTVRATLSPGKTAEDLIRAIFPCGSITGAPKIRAMELINQVERDPRGPYCGAIGRIDAPDEHGLSNAAFNVAIRTLRLSPIENAQGKAMLGVGSAIVADSDAMAERRECEVKAGFVRSGGAGVGALGCDLIETMRFEPTSGIDLLEGHLARIKASAAELGFSFDRHAARNQIQALCFELEHPARIRMLVSRSGNLALEAGTLPDVSNEGVTCIALPIPLDPSDWRLAHKTSDRSFYEDALDAAKDEGAGEALFVRDDGLVTEGSFANVFVEGDNGILLTPPARLGLLPGVLRAALLEQGKAREAELALNDLDSGFILGNAVRGLFPAKLKK